MVIKAGKRLEAWRKEKHTKWQAPRLFSCVLPLPHKEGMRLSRDIQHRFHI